MNRFGYLALNKLLPLLEPRSNVEKPLERVIWIVGAPRSGTTLTYQLLTYAFRSTYITNWVANLYRAPIIASKLQDLFPKESTTEFSSDFGKTNGLWGPHEGGQYLYRFFPVSPQRVSSTYWETNLSKLKQFRSEISTMGASTGVFMLKNTVNALRIEALYEAFPQSVFVWVERDLLSNVYSIVQGRRKAGSLTEWWGIQPPNFEKQRSKSVVEQVIWQVKETQNMIQHSLLQCGAPNVKVDYSVLCTSPASFVHQVEEVTGMKRKPILSFPTLKVSTPKDDNLSQEIKRALNSTL